MTAMPPLAELIARNALFVVNHSGGKDSQAMLIVLQAMGVPAAQMLVVHASLGEMEWEGAMELARDHAAAAGAPFIVAKAAKSLLDMVEHRFATRPGVPSWPSSSSRQCTSDLKRDPIAREVRRFANARGINLVVNCLGIRAAESSARSKKKAWSRSERNSTQTREWFEWYPIFDMSTRSVFSTIRAAGQEPHPAYAAGNDRLSCVFCVMACAADLAHGARARPELFAKYVELEERTGYTMHMSRKSLRELVAEAEALAELPQAA